MIVKYAYLNKYSTCLVQNVVRDDNSAKTVAIWLHHTVSVLNLSWIDELTDADLKLNKSAPNKLADSTKIPRSAPSIAVGLVGGEARADDLHRYCMATTKQFPVE